VLALHGNILCVELPSFYEFRERFGDRCLGRNWVGSNHLDTAEFCPVGCGLITIEYLYISFSISLFAFQTHLSVQNILLFIYHGDSLHRAYLGAYSAPFAVFQIYLDRYSFADDSLWTIEPA